MIVLILDPHMSRVKDWFQILLFLILVTAQSHGRFPEFRYIRTQFLYVQDGMFIIPIQMSSQFQLGVVTETA